MAGRVVSAAGAIWGMAKEAWWIWQRAGEMLRSDGHPEPPKRWPDYPEEPGP